MVGGSGSKLLPITAAEADIANLIPPIIKGKDALQNPLPAVRLDKRDLKRRIDTLRGLVRKSGRDVSSVLIGGFVLGAVTSIIPGVSRSRGSAELSQGEPHRPVHHRAVEEGVATEDVD